MFAWSKGKGSTRLNELNFIDGTKYDNKYIRCMRRIFGYAILSKKNALFIDSKIDITGFDAIHRDLWMEIVDGYYNYSIEFDQEKFATMISDKPEMYDVFKNDVNLLSKDFDPYNDNDMLLCIDVFNEYKIQRDIEDLKIKLKAEETSEGKKYYMNEIVKFQRKLKK